MTATAPSTIAFAEPAASPELAHQHFASRLAFECDATDVAHDLRHGVATYTIIDARSAESYARGHIPGAVNLPPSRINQTTVSELPAGPLVVYCWGPACNGAHRAAVLLTEHDRQVKEMLGGFGYWIREGQPIEGSDAAALAELAE